MTNMFVNQLLSEARERLNTIGTESLLTDAARALSTSKSEVVVVCDPSGKAAGVITKADVLWRITHCEGGSMHDHSSGCHDTTARFLRP
jgi:predicted transcriptional regulator